MVETCHLIIEKTPFLMVSFNHQVNLSCIYIIMLILVYRWLMQKSGSDWIRANDQGLGEGQ
jgi:hypothetical protein